MQKILIEAKDVAIGHEGVVACEHINFVVHQNDYLCIIGENGAGKTTLMETLLRILKPLGGHLHFENCKIGYLPQQQSLEKDFPATVFEVVLSGMLNKGLWPFYTRVEKDMATQALARLGVQHLSKKPFKHLSGGQQQRVLLARALCAASDVLMVDEPTSSLDPATSLEFYNILEQLHKDGMTIIMITHDVDASLPYATHVLSLGKQNQYYAKEGEV